MTEGPMLSYIEQVNLLPAYSPPEAARYLHIPVTTVRAWIRGQTYWTQEGERLFRKVVIPADEATSYLSFTNLIELMVLDDLRKRFSIPLGKVRTAIESARKTFRTDHPLADLSLLSDSTDVFVDRLGEYLNLSTEGQLVMRSVLKECLRKVVKDESGVPRKLYPLGPQDVVEIDPQVNFGRPSLSGCGIATEVVFERSRSGEDADFLARDYGCDRELIQKAIQYEIASREKAA